MLSVFPSAKRPPLTLKHTTLPSHSSRLVNAVIAVLGLTLLGVGIYAAVVDKKISARSGLPIGLGLVDALFGTLLVIPRGVRSLFFLRLYGLVMGLGELGQLAGAIIFLVPASQQQILKELGASEDTVAELNTAGYVLIGLTLLQALSLGLVFRQTCAQDRGFDENADFTEEALLGGNSKKSTDKFGALSDELEGGAVPTAVERYREKVSCEREAARMETRGTAQGTLKRVLTIPPSPPSKHTIHPSAAL